MISKSKTKSSLPDQVIEIPGGWGKGDQAIGELVCFEKGSIFDLKRKHRDHILAFQETLNRGLWHKAKGVGVRGIICGGLPDKKFAQEVEKEVLRVDGEERRIGLPLVVIGDKGRIPQESWQVLNQNQGKKVVIEGDNCRVLIPK